VHFELTEEQALIQDAARKFAEDRLKPHAAEWDETKHFPVDVLKESAAMGFAGIYTRDDVGGSGMSRVDAALIFEQLSRGCVSTAAFISIHNMVSWMIDSWGSEEQRQRWLPDLTAMNTIASYCLTEPGAALTPPICAPRRCAMAIIMCSTVRKPSFPARGPAICTP
jgi:alkylation response protein AidB-like acyl-CoA dehydrogenase